MKDGRCKTLDAGADGYMRGEACVVHLIEAFEAAELAACHLVDGALLLHGTAVNQDGRSSSLTVRKAHVCLLWHRSSACHASTWYLRNFMLRVRG